MKKAQFKEFRHSQTVDFSYSRGDIDILSHCFHEYYEIYLLLNGNVTYVSEQGSFDLAAYDLVVTRPHEYHHFNVKDNLADYTRYVLKIYPSAFSDKKIFNELKEKEIYHLHPNDFIVQNFVQLHQYCADIYEKDFEALAQSIAKIIILSLKYVDTSEQTVDSTKNAPWILNNALNYITENINRPFTLSDIANTCNVSTSTLSHSFRQYYSMPVMRYVSAKRLGLADNLLSSGISPGEVYRQCGYEDYTTFYRAYKQFYNRPPSNKK